jgi:hypothetical protein
MRANGYIIPVELVSSITGKGILSVDNSAQPLGGSISTFGNYTIHTFNADGTFTNYSDLVIDILLVGGGGGGAVFGGGGAGGLLHYTSVNLPPGSYGVTIGQGGAPGSNLVDGGMGGNTIFGALYTAFGGGGAGKSQSNGLNGGSGGGGGSNVNIGETHAGGSGGPGQGNNGGPCNGGSGSPCGGGGGAGAAGIVYDGGIGLSIDINGVATYYAGGGGGASYNQSHGVGGLGGGGNAATQSGGIGGNGTPNTGGGGGAAKGALPFYPGSGGSGILILRYLK